MRQSVLTLWFATFITFFVPVLGCYQRFYTYYKEYQNCHEALSWGLEPHLAKECATLGQKFKDLNAQPVMQQIFGRDITSGLDGTVKLGNESPNCIAWRCGVTAWRFREWQNNLENTPLPSMEGWRFAYEYFDRKVDC
ncbi:hypothetical protein CFE70_009781 [Pyrenophora teres f. teres 0-1]|uniref:Avirulence Effector AvrLm4-7 domain-containing protein n=2 Tax=Pyrenophora teres f. teres TaxID=97479 RepID=E3RP91_PYRTT|nr:hypothetical protein PTT_10442 [Pyrenophora teres f. teres 0-1]KAE8827006.1 hypothetical protein HRS9139_08178 [Pyrenophora teres f. teres]KAE8832523.1 hypothetical protein PTNB85_06915 [Pyrenophora teres f. teres]KAE8836868.1 hypothetical protein HRS9122_07023 [Pyrenophora teres f. teres]KAE8856185.1 hypothetical protein PTNB29_09024 [Pyrenophora teres f. teres]